jgi:hypothetical protein
VVVKELLGEMKDPSPLSLARRVAMIPPPPSHCQTPKKNLLYLLIDRREY